MFNSKELKKLHRKGYLDEIIKKYNLSEKNLMGAGGDASAFKFNDREVLKICTKKKKIFNRSDFSAEDFMLLSQKYKHIFLPMNKILYENDHFFVYTQYYYSNEYNRNNVELYMVRDLLTIAYNLIKDGEIETNLSPHNLAMYNNKVLVFDYHALRFIKWKNESVYKKKWFRNFIKHIYTTAATIYCKEYRENIRVSLKNKLDSGSYELIKEIGNFPECWVNMLFYITNNHNNLSLFEICQHLKNCIQYYS